MLFEILQNQIHRSALANVEPKLSFQNIQFLQVTETIKMKLKQIIKKKQTNLETAD